MKKAIFLTCFSFLSVALYAQHEGHSHDAVVPPGDTKLAVGGPAKLATPTIAVKEEMYDFGKSLRVSLFTMNLKLPIRALHP